jgi:O-antigen ligase
VELQAAPAPSSPPAQPPLVQSLAMNLIAKPAATPQIRSTSAPERAVFTLSLAAVFLRFSYLHELLSGIFGLDFYLVFIVGTAATLAVIFNGGLQRTFRWRAAQFWALFALWVLLAVPSSQWISDSLNTWFQYVRVNFSMLFVIAGVTLTVRDCYRMMSAIALGAVVNLLSSTFFADNEARLSLAFGTVGRSNDYAAHLLLVLPFLLWVGLTAQHKIVRFACVALVIYGVFVGAKTGSRGAMLAVAAVGVFLIIRSRGAALIVSAVALPILGIVAFLILPQSLRDRYMTTFQDNSKLNTTNEAVGSYEARQYLLTSSLDLALTHPIFGVGPNEFTIAEADVAKSEGRRGAWQPPHNSYTQVASEAGIPAFIFFVAAVIATFRLLNRCYKRCAGHPHLQRLRLGAFCMMLSAVGFGVAIFFLNMPYMLYLPALTGLAIAVNRAADDELKSAPATS